MSPARSVTKGRADLADSGDAKILSGLTAASAGLYYTAMADVTAAVVSGQIEFRLRLGVTGEDQLPTVGARDVHIEHLPP